MFCMQCRITEKHDTCTIYKKDSNGDITLMYSATHVLEQYLWNCKDVTVKHSTTSVYGYSVVHRNFTFTSPMLSVKF